MQTLCLFILEGFVSLWPIAQLSTRQPTSLLPAPPTPTPVPVPTTPTPLIGWIRVKPLQNPHVLAQCLRIQLTSEVLVKCLAEFVGGKKPLIRAHKAIGQMEHTVRSGISAQIVNRVWIDRRLFDSFYWGKIGGKGPEGAMGEDASLGLGKWKGNEKI